MLKTCSGCLTSLPLALFYRDAAKRDGHHHRCKSCDRMSSRRAAASMDLTASRSRIRLAERLDRNEREGLVIYLDEQTALIRLFGRFAVGGYQFATVDAKDADRLAAWHWKAKPNADANNIYAVREEFFDGEWCRTVRMHREVISDLLYDGCDVDHINHDGLDNRRTNLRAVSRSVNVRNRRPAGTRGFIAA